MALKKMISGAMGAGGWAVQQDAATSVAATSAMGTRMGGV